MLFQGHLIFNEELPSLREHYNHSESLDPRLQEVNEIAYGIIALVIITVGVIGNILTIFILNLPQFRGVTYTYFFILAVSDLLALLFSISVFYHLTHETTLRYSTAVWYSYFEGFCANVFLSTSIFIVICVTVDRYYSVCRPVKFKTIHNHKHAKKMLIGAFSVSVLVWLPVCFLKTPKEFYECEDVYFIPPDNRTRWVACMEIPKIPTEDWYFIYSWIRQTVVTFIPIVVLITLNTLTLRGFIRLKKHRRELRRKSICFSTDMSHSGEGRSQSDQNLINLLTAVIITFFCTMVPVGIYNAVYTESYSNDFSYQVFRAVANNLEILNHALNFYMYILYCKPIRQTLKNHLCCCSHSSATDFISKVKNRIKKLFNCQQQSLPSESDAEMQTSDLAEGTNWRQKLKRSPNEVQPDICENGISDDSFVNHKSGILKYPISVGVSLDNAT